MDSTAIGLKEVEEGIWLVSFMDYDLGYVAIWREKLFNLWTTRLAQKCNLCVRYVVLPMSPGRT